MKFAIVLFALAGYVAADGIASVTRPIVTKVIDPIAKGVGHGIEAVAAGTEKTADLLGEAASTVVDTVGTVAADAEVGVGVALQNVASAAQDTAKALDKNTGIVGDIARRL